MTLKANANQQSTVTSFGGERRVVGRATFTVPAQRRISRHPGRFFPDAMLVSENGDVNLNFEVMSGDLGTEVTLGVAVALAGSEILFGQRQDSGIVVAAGLDEDEDEEDDAFEDDDELDEDDEDLEDEDDEEFDDDLDEEDDDLEDDDVDDEEDEVEDDE